MENVFPIRLKQARLMRGMSMEALCAATGNKLTKQAIHKYETGKMLPNSTSLIALVNALQVSADYLFSPVTVTINRIEFRKKQELSVNTVNRIKEELRDKIEKYLEIEALTNSTPTLKNNFVPGVIKSQDDACDAASHIKKLWNLGDVGINNLIEILEDNGIKVIEISEGPAFGGLCAIVNGNIPVIMVNQTFSSERKRFTALHELAHLVLNFDSHLTQKQIEKLCNTFASEMLISRQTLLRKMGGNRKSVTLQELIALQDQYGIAIDAIMYKAKEIGIVSESGYRNFCKKKGSYPALKKEIEESRTKPELPVRYVSLVHRALLDQLISQSKAADLLDKTIGQLRMNFNPVI